MTNENQKDSKGRYWSHEIWASRPDDMYHAEDPDARSELIANWVDREYRRRHLTTDSCGCGGSCSNCDPMYKD